MVQLQDAFYPVVQIASSHNLEQGTQPLVPMNVHRLGTHQFEECLGNLHAFVGIA